MSFERSPVRIASLISDVNLVTVRDSSRSFSLSTTGAEAAEAPVFSGEPRDRLIQRRSVVTPSEHGPAVVGEARSRVSARVIEETLVAPKDGVTGEGGPGTSGLASGDPDCGAETLGLVSFEVPEPTVGDARSLSASKFTAAAASV